MTGFRVDTHIISEVWRPAPDAGVAAWSRGVSKGLLFLSVVSMGGFHKALTIMPSGTRRAQLEKLIEDLRPAWFAGRILPVTQPIAERWGVLEGQRQLTVRPIHVPDAQISATALVHGLTVVPRNEKDCENLGVTIFNPWDLA